MAGIIYSASAGLNDAKLGKMLTPLRTVIEYESDLAKKNDKVLETLFNVATSNNWAETIQYQDEFGEFMYAPEGSRGENDSMADTFAKVIEHIPFIKEFTITKQMMDDAKYGVSADMSRRAAAFTRAYYKTRMSLGVKALTGATASAITFNGASVDLTTADKLPLFHNAHLFGNDKSHGQGTQSNHFYLPRSSGETNITLEAVMNLIEEGVHRIRTMKDENGEVLGYTADTIIIPGNQPLLERYVKQALGSEYMPTGGTNAINVQAGNWNLVVLPTWAHDAASGELPILVMSSEANKNLDGSMFFNRVPLDIKDYIDESSRNWNWNGYCRFGIGFATYKHIVRLVSCSNGKTVTNASAI